MTDPRVQDPGSLYTLIFLGNREEAHAAASARALESVKGTIDAAVAGALRSAGFAV